MNTYRGLSNKPEERNRSMHPYCFWNNVFSEEELKILEHVLDHNGTEEAKVGVLDTDSDVPVGDYKRDTRRSRVRFYNPMPENQWVFDRFNFILDAINEEYYNFDLNGYSHFQYTTYHGEDQGTYDWHIDMEMGHFPKDIYQQRKLSMTFLLNDPKTDFKGGELQIGTPDAPYEKKTVPVEKNTAIIFPSFQLHRVAPVTEGTRKSIVVWVVGPKFK